MSDAMYSTPIYQDYASIRKHASSYVIVLEQDDDAVLQQIYAQFSPDASYSILIASSTDLQGWEQVKNALSQYLAQVKAGVHTVVVGSEAFIWQIQQTLTAQGCMHDEYSLIRSASKQKAVYCVHCSHQQMTQATEFCHCEACGVYLLIRSHFSERLGAYMGVCANAHQPMGETV